METILLVRTSKWRRENQPKNRYLVNAAAQKIINKYSYNDFHNFPYTLTPTPYTLIQSA